MENAPCIDGDACTTAEHCKGGLCVGAKIVCNDGDLCTVDDCDSIDSCVALANGVAACDDNDACTADSCDKINGCAHMGLDGGFCDDGDPCSSADTCSAGKCKGKPGGACDDGNPCTDDSCAGDGKSCLHKANVAPCGDGRTCLNGQCGGCEAFRRVHRLGCDEILAYNAVGVDFCKDANNFDREEYEAAAVFANGNVVAAGAASTDKTNKTAGMLTMYSSSGKLIWDKTFGTPGLDRLFGAAAGSKNEVIACGSALAAGVQRPWLLRVAEDGSQVLSVTLPSSDPKIVATKGQFDDVVVLADGSIAAVGSQLAASGANAAVVARFDASGALIWQRIFSLPGGDGALLSQRLFGARRTADGSGLILAGDSNNPKALDQGLDGWATRIDVSGNTVWSKTFGGKGIDGFYGLDIAADGSIVAAGVVNKASSKAPGDGWLVTLNAKGEKVSEEVVATADHEEFRGVVCGADGSVSAVGQVEVDHTGQVGYSATYDKAHAWAVRWSAPGKIAWNHRFAALAVEKFAGAALAANGDVVAVGDTHPADILDKPDALVLRLDATGNDLCKCPMFKIIADTPGESRLYGVVRLSDDSVIAVGWQAELDGTTDALLGRWDRFGKVVWQANLGGKGDEQLRGLVRDDSGVMWAVGSSSSGVGKLDGWLARFDEDGKILSQVSYGGSENDDFRGISPIPAKLGGGWIVTGATASGSLGKNDGWVVRLDATGKTVWNKTFGTAVDERFDCAGVTASGTIVLGGESLASKANTTKALWPWTRTIGLDGAPLAEAFLTSDASGGGIFGAATLPAGGVALVGKVLSTPGAPGAILAYDDNGAILKQIGGTNPWSGSSFFGMLALPTGGNVAFGSALGFSRPWTARYDAAWKELWDNTIHNTTLPGAEFYAGAVTADGSAVFVGRLAQDGVDKGLLIREHLSRSQTGADTACKGATQCESGGCDVVYGCVKTDAALLCNDGNYCTVGDQCNTGKCNENMALVCDDGNPCTADKCASGGGCFTTAANESKVCGADKVCDASGNCGKCPYVRSAIGADEFIHFALGSADAGSGNFLVSGYSTLGCCSKYDGFVAKFDTAGTKLWDTKMGSATLNDRLGVVIALSDGGAVAGGSQDVGTGKNYIYAQLVRLDKAGKVVWQTLQGLPTGKLGINGLHVLGNAGYFVGADGAKSRFGEFDLANGAVVWETSGNLPGSASDEWNSVLKMADGGWILTGNTKGSNNYADGVVERLSADKKVLWTYQSATLGDDNLLQSLLGSDGSLTALGTHGPVEGGANDSSWAIRLNVADGKVIWEYSPLQVYWQRFASALLAKDGSVILVGAIESGLNTSFGGIWHISNAGQLLWQKLTTLQNFSGLVGVTPDPAGTFTAQGWAAEQGGQQAMMQRFAVDGSTQCAP